MSGEGFDPKQSEKENTERIMKKKFTTKTPKPTKVPKADVDIGKGIRNFKTTKTWKEAHKERTDGIKARSEARKKKKKD